MKPIRFLMIGGFLTFSVASYAQSPPAGGLELWLRADAGVTTNASGLIINWADQSGSGRDLSTSFTSDTGYWPKYLANAINGQPSIQFDGGTDGKQDQVARTNADVNTVFTGNEVSMFFVKKQTSPDNGTDAFRLNSPDDASNRMNLHLAFFGTMYFDYGDIGAGGRISGSVPLGWYDAYHLLHLNRQTSGSGFIDVDWKRAVSGTFTDALDPTSAALLTLAPSPGEVAEILIYDHALSGADQEAVLSYLGQKYNIVPEPSAVALLGVGGFLLWRRRTDQVRNPNSEIRNKSE